jgi:hypothetical protein
MDRSPEPADYDLDEHRHRFAVWAAARAAQRGFVGVGTLRKALEQCGVVEFLRRENLDEITKDRFEAKHREWCRSIHDYLTNAGVPNSTFGRAAKLLEVYLKSAVFLGPGSRTALAHFAHPPIDSILLKGVACARKGCKHANTWAKVRWTALDEDSYYQLIGQLRLAIGSDAPFWTLESHWTVTSDRSHD